MKFTDHLKGESTFRSYSQGQLWYQTEAGLLFGIPVEEIEGLQLKPAEESTRLVRWIRAGWTEVVASIGENVQKNTGEGVANTPEPA